MLNRDSPLKGSPIKVTPMKLKSEDYKNHWVQKKNNVTKDRERIVLGLKQINESKESQEQQSSLILK